MFFSSIVVSSIFGTYDESERKDLTNELLEENGEVYQKGGLYQELIIEPKGKINEYGEKIEDNKKEKNIKNEENKKQKKIDNNKNEYIENIVDNFSIKEVDIMLCDKCNSNIEIKEINTIQMEITYECLKCGIRKKLINEYMKTMIQYSNNLKKSKLCYNCSSKDEQNMKYCLKCDKIICLNCTYIHIKTSDNKCKLDYIINYNEKNIKCKLHPKRKNKCFCEDCNFNLCDECIDDKDQDHTFHRKIYFEELNERINKGDFRDIVESLKKEKKKIRYDKELEKNRLKDKYNKEQEEMKENYNNKLKSIKEEKIKELTQEEDEYQRKIEKNKEDFESLLKLLKKCEEEKTNIIQENKMKRNNIISKYDLKNEEEEKKYKIQGENLRNQFNNEISDLDTIFKPKIEKKEDLLNFYKLIERVYEKNTNNKFSIINYKNAIIKDLKDNKNEII